MASALAACMPFATPPLRASLGREWHLERVPGSSGAAPDTGALLLRAGLHPLDLFPGAENNLFDVGIGYESELPRDPHTPAVYGPYAEFGAYPLRVPLAPSLNFRGGGYVTADGLFRNGEKPGIGASLGTLFEIVGGTSGSFASAGSEGSVLGYAAGLWSVGIFGSLGVRDFPDGGYRAATLGVSLRIPFTAGVACCAWPHHAEADAGPAPRASRERIEAPPHVERKAAEPKPKQ